MPPDALGVQQHHTLRGAEQHRRVGAVAAACSKTTKKEKRGLNFKLLQFQGLIYQALRRKAVLQQGVQMPLRLGQLQGA